MSWRLSSRSGERRWEEGRGGGGGKGGRETYAVPRAQRFVEEVLAAEDDAVERIEPEGLLFPFSTGGGIGGTAFKSEVLGGGQRSGPLLRVVPARRGPL